ncbi:MAG: MBL fold metallo-hydrolase, partial [Longimicrobiales bacterium]
LDEVETRGLRVEAILLTHAHLDHIDGLAEAQRQTEAPVYLHPADRMLFDNAASQAAMFGVPFETPEPPDHELVPGETLVVGGESFDVRFAPGHAPGHVIFVSKSSPVALVGDVIFAGSIGRTDLPGGDYQELMNSIRSQVLTLPKETQLFTGHGPATTVEHEGRTNPFVIPLYGGEFA